MSQEEVCGVVRAGGGGRETVLYASVPGRRDETWSRFQPLGVEFPELPIRNMYRSDYFYGTFADLCLAAAAEDPAYMKYCVRIDKGTGGLRLYVQPTCVEPWFVYDLDMPAEPPVAAINTALHPYPQPSAMHYVTGRTFVAMANDEEVVPSQ